VRPGVRGGFWLALMVLWLLACGRPGLAPGGAARMPLPGFATGLGAYGDTRPRTLLLYDTTGPWGFLGELYAQQTANLVSHFGAWQAGPVAAYTAGQMEGYQAVVYLGSTYDEPLPGAFLADLKARTRPVIWCGANLWQLEGGPSGLAASHGWAIKGYDRTPLTGVTYKGTRFERNVPVSDGLLGTVVTDPRRAQVLAMAFGPGGAAVPWAVRSGQFTFVSEIPLSYVGPDDRYLVFTDLLFDALAPSTRPRHRALVRLEDVGPDSDPAQLRALADILAARKIPFAVAVYPAYRDPLGAYHQGRSTAQDLAGAAELGRALGYLRARGGTLVMHGYTHQFGETANPYSGASADDFEFYRAHRTAGGGAVMDGPVPGDSQAWAGARLRDGLAAFAAAGLPPPAIFEFPHYAGSAEDYRAVQAEFGIRYDRGLYFPGFLAGKPPGQPVDQYFPYLVRDVYGSLVVPENLGNVAMPGYNNMVARHPADILRTAARNLVIRDGFASFFYHPPLGTALLTELVDGLRAQGWTFVSVQAALR